MPYAEIAFFTAEPVAHCVEYAEQQRARMIARRNKSALADYERRTGSRAR